MNTGNVILANQLYEDVKLAECITHVAEGISTLAKAATRIHYDDYLTNSSALDAISETSLVLTSLARRLHSSLIERERQAMEMQCCSDQAHDAKPAEKESDE